MKTISFDLSIKSIEDAIQQIEEYKSSFRYKLSLFLERLADIGITTIDDNMATEGDSSPDHSAYVRIESSGDYAEATLVLQGRDIAFIEFGAGVHFNENAGSSPHPKGAALGYTIGSYGYGQGAKDHWTYMSAETGNRETSYGTKAAMPMYKAEVEMTERFKTIAREVFGG